MFTTGEAIAFTAGEPGGIFPTIFTRARATPVYIIGPLSQSFLQERGVHGLVWFLLASLSS